MSEPQSDAKDSRPSADDGPPSLVDLARDLARGNADSIESYLDTVRIQVPIDGTKARATTHFIKLDPSGRPRVEALAGKLVKQVVDYCIPRSRIKEAEEHFLKFHSTEMFTELDNEARELFTPLERSGEGGELLLFFLLECYLRIPQILCKMSLKTSSSMHVHGSDGVHATLLSDETLALYWAESKMHATTHSAIDECFSSIAPYLTPGETASRRDLLLLRDNLNVGDSKLSTALVRYFIDDTPEAAKVEIRGACLVGFDWDSYSKLYSEDGKTLTLEVAAEIETWHKRFKDRIGKHKLSAIEIEIFCVPVPSVELFRKAIKKNLNGNKS